MMALRAGNGSTKPPVPRFAKPRATPHSSHDAHDHHSPLTVSRPELLVNGSDYLYRKFVHELLSFAAMHGAIRDGIAGCVDLGGVQHTILQSIRHLGVVHPVAVRDVAQHLGLSGAFITIETAKLQDRGLLEKRPSTTDRRKVSLVLTKKAYGLFEKAAPIQQAIGDVQFGCLSARQFREIVPIVTRLFETSREALLLLPHLKTVGEKKTKRPGRKKIANRNRRKP
jgi:DNA-binding MarR family transcriptional regulator